jgi:hypothetical protein
MPPGSPRPSRLYRTAVEQTLFRYAAPADVDPDLALRSHLEASHTRESARLRAAVASGAPGEEVTAIRNGLFVFAVGLFAFGRSDLAEEVIDHLPASGDIRRLALAIKALLPLPAELDVLRDGAAVKRWLTTNLTHFHWSEELGRYVSPSKP